MKDDFWLNKSRYVVDHSVDLSEASSSGSRQRRNSNQSIYGSTNSSTHRREPGSMKFTIQEILKATKNFSPTLKIGQGGFGTVYKGHLEDGTIVAIKRAKKVRRIFCCSSYEKHMFLVGCCYCIASF